MWNKLAKPFNHLIYVHFWIFGVKLEGKLVVGMVLVNYSNKRNYSYSIGTFKRKKYYESRNGSASKILNHQNEHTYVELSVKSRVYRFFS